MVSALGTREVPSMSAAKHTPTPPYTAELSPARREYNGPNADWIVVSDDGLLCEGMCEAEARFVASACNSHDALVAALEPLAALPIPDGMSDHDTVAFFNGRAICVRHVREAQAALKAAKGVA
jgi:hypothetical protein